MSGYKAAALEAFPPVAELERQGLIPRTPFQTPLWLQSWYGTLGAAEGVRPALVRVEAEGEAAMLLPLVVRRSAGRRVLTFADDGVSDYNAPLLGPAAPRTAADAKACWRAAIEVLPRIDLAVLERMPTALPPLPTTPPPAAPYPSEDGAGEGDAGNAGRADGENLTPNALSRLPGTGEADLQGQLLEVDDFGYWRRKRLARHFRKEQDRCWRLFDKRDGAGFTVVAPEQAAGVYDQLCAFQRDKAGQAGFDYRLDRPLHDAFYRRLIERGLRPPEASPDAGRAGRAAALEQAGAGHDAPDSALSGTTSYRRFADARVVLTALEAKGATVAVLFGVATAERYVMVRIADAGGEWRACSPGRLLIERTIEHLHAQGLRRFDFGIGNYPHKRRFGAQPVDLLNVTSALSPLGLPAAWRAGAKAQAKRHPRVLQAIRALRQVRTAPTAESDGAR